MNTLFGDLLYRRRKEKRLSASKVARDIGVSRGLSIDRYEKGEQLPSDDKLQLLADALDLDVLMLIEALTEDYKNARMTGVFEGQSFTGDIDTSAIANIASNTQAPVIALANTKPHITGSLPTPSSEMQWRPVPSDIFKRTLFFTPMTGDSMTAPGGTSIPNGALILFDSSKTPESGDTIIAIPAGGTPTIKILIDDGGTKFLKSANPAFPLLQAQDCEILAVAVRTETDL